MSRKRSAAEAAALIEGKAAYDTHYSQLVHNQQWIYLDILCIDGHYKAWLNDRIYEWDE